MFPNYPYKGLRTAGPIPLERADNVTAIPLRVPKILRLGLEFVSSIVLQGNAKMANTLFPKRKRKSTGCWRARGRRSVNGVRR